MRARPALEPMMDRHVREHLSAYRDDALSPAERAEVAGHLAACASCRAADAELGAVTRLVAALPPPVPSRRLVPTLGPRWTWLRPVRSLSAVGTGAFLLIFTMSATLDTGWGMGGGGRATEGRGSRDVTETRALPKTDAAGQRGPFTAGASTPRPGAVPAAAPTGAEGAAGAAGAAGDLRATAPPRAPEIGPTPWLWLALAALCAALALGAHRRLRAP